MSVVIPDALTVLIPIIVTALAYFLRHDKLSQSVNALIAFADIFIIAVACAWLSGGWTSDWRAQTGIILAYAGSLAAIQFKPILDWLYSLDSPLLQIPAHKQPAHSPLIHRMRNPASMDTLPEHRAVQPPRPPTQQL